MNRLAILGFLSLFISGNDVFFDEIQDMGNNEISINFNVDKVSLVRSYSLEDPSRIVMEVNQSSLPAEINVPYNYPIKKVRASQDGSLTRIVVDLYESVHWQNPTQTINTENIKLELKVKRNKNLNKSIRDIVVAIDAGHGGKYPGAVGPNNILEKDVTLLIAKELERTLRDTYGYRPVMIRDGDETLDLNNRYQDARKYGADIFVSIHADGFRLSSVKGASVFIWSDEASSTVARNLSKKQRQRIQADIKNLKPVDFDEDAARQTYPEMYKKKISESKILGTKILDQLKRDPFTKIHKKNVEYADFRVLKSIDIPSVLVESGFITNPEDAQRLKGKPGRRMIARSVFLGIHNYFKDKPKANTFMSIDPGYVTYKIQKGDVLSEIAIRFGVTVEEINTENKLNNKPIYPGQLIKINI
ncbi:N-acetylmuramoyl-L-alanine amidase [Gammaproteobacteria bacterium]|nr:N-acetylmuramoyl-L-alanine amidase [Gammaproteobacteria bacterium]MDA7734940.1 N-acetylmuramoyl-L-alanine amidase [Gammaproteobacteria bacterium]MDA8925784.1 N-acetylmuramoyl-L-alanine amidase [Gammaproteobacteria bacterium]MDA8998748.1 N-acetylmuramoyl-L-alanine amidase [Gammaproteobacteria bacterium]MDA9113310.1 N-acetylmuramoyl-L-alanine amidase [Gammaproteobacteria bacterium]